MSPLLAVAAGWVLSRMFDVFAKTPAAAQPPPASAPRRRAPQRSRRPNAPGPAPTAPSSSASPPGAATTVRPVSTTSTVPWPQIAPSGLPPFPGAGWEPDQPPPPAVVTRANQLLSALWAGGPGTFKPEQTAGRWIIYRATPMGEKKGVVAFRESQHAAFLTQPSSPSNANASSSSPSIVPVSTASPSTALPLLVRGSRGEEVKILQRKLGITDDGAFGPGTEAAVRNFQSRNGLTPDGKVGPQTWGALLGRAAA